jgi:hypothetical protein
VKHAGQVDRDDTEWFTTYVYLPKLRAWVVLESAIRSPGSIRNSPVWN